MGTEHSRPSGHGEKDRGGKNRYATSSTTVGSDGRPDLPSTGFSKFSKALQAWMRADVDNLEKLTSLINTESYTVSGKTIDSVKDEKNHTALHFAVLAQKPHIVKYLLECGCQARTLNDSWQTALHDAIDLGNHDIVMLLLEFGAPNVCLSTNGLGELPIHTAARLFSRPNGERIFWDILICSGVEELNRMMPNGMSVLHVAAAENYAKLIRILLDPTRNGPRAFVNVAHTDGTTPLHLAVAKGHRRAVDALVQHNADPNATNFFGETALHFACQASSDHCAETILSTDPSWRKGDSKRPEFGKAMHRTRSGDLSAHPAKVRDSNHLRMVVIEVKDFGLNLPLHYASGMLPFHDRKLGDSRGSEVVGPVFVTGETLAKTAAPGSTSSSSTSTSGPGSTKRRKGSIEHTATSSSSPGAASSSATGASTSNTATSESSSSPTLRPGSVPATVHIKPRTLSIKLIERMLDLELRHSRMPNHRKYAYSIVTPNRAGYSPMDIAEFNQDTELIQLFKQYTPPESEVPSDSDFLSIQLTSDIHLECLAHDQPSGRKVTKQLVAKTKAKYVALLGDIGLADRPYYKDFLVRMSKRYTYVFVVFGNHEYYNTTTRAALAAIESIVSENPNVIWLRAGHPFELEGVKIIGDTLWSHIAEDEAETIGFHMNDYRRITVVENGTTRNLSPDDTMKWHIEQLQYLKTEVELSKKKNQPVLIMTHHAPLVRFGVTNPGLWESAEPEINSAFCTDLSGMFGSPIVGWLYGHTHWNHNMTINDTVIAANQGGYIMGEVPTLPPNYDPKFVVKVPKQLPPTTPWATSGLPNPAI